MYIYKIFNTVNSFVYIGMTTRTPEIRWKEHLYHSKRTDRRLYRAMRRHGVENFKMEPIAYLKDFKDQDLIFEIEEKYIKQKNSYWFGYNDTTGGRGFIGNRPKRGRKRKEA